MKKYTIIYGEFFQTGNQRNSITRMKHIECFPQDIKSTVEESIDFGDVWFILEGHCIETQD